MTGPAPLSLSQLGTLTGSGLLSLQGSPSLVMNSLQTAMWYRGLLGTSGLVGSPEPEVIFGAFAVKNHGSWGVEKSAKTGDSLVAAQNFHYTETHITAPDKDDNGSGIKEGNQQQAL